MKKERGPAGAVVLCITFVIICIALFYAIQTPSGTNFLMKVLGSIQPNQPSQVNQPDTQAVSSLGKKITFPDGTIGCKRDALVCPDGSVKKRVLPTCTFPRCP
jgi:hypothetical protein